jgi:hypothetical protein
VVVSFVADAAWRFRGLAGSGNADGVWRVKYGVTPHYAVRTQIVSQVALLTLPNPDAQAASQTVTVEVTNLGTGVGDFECTLLGE